MAFQPNFRMVRAEDQLVLDVALEGMTIGPSPTGGRVHQLALVNKNIAGRIRVTFQTQQTVEYARDAQGVRLFQPKPIFAPPSTVILAVAANTAPVPATVAGVLDLARRLPLVTDSRAGTVAAADVVSASSRTSRLPAAEAISATRAAITGTAIDPELLRRRDEDRRRRRAAVAPVVITEDGATSETGSATAAVAGAGDTSAFALPYLLVVRPPGGATRLDHPIQAIRTNNRYPLWMSSLGVNDGERTAEATLPVLFRATTQSAAKTPEWVNIVDDGKLDNSLDGADAVKLEKQTDPPSPAPGQPQPPTQPAGVRRLRLSSLGGWLEVNGRWPSGITRYQHSVAMGRDQSQLVVEKGVLFPFGFTATATSQTVRVIERGSSRVAALHSESTIVIEDPVAIFGSFTEQPGWPYRQITCLTTNTGVGSLDPAKNNGAETVPGVKVFTVRDRPFEYQLSAIDRMGQQVLFHLPLLFVPDTTIGDSKLPELWRAQGSSYTDIDVGGQPHGMAPESAADEAADRAEPADRGVARAVALERAAETLPTPAGATTVLVRTLKFNVVDPLGRAAMTHVKGVVPSLDKVLPGTELVLAYTAAYVTGQFDDALNAGKAFLQVTAEQAGQQVVRPVVGLGKQLAGEAAGQAAALTGGLATAALPIAAFSRKYGAVAGSAAKIASGDLDLETIIGAGDTLLGILPLRDLFAKAGGGALKSLRITDDNYKLTTDVQDGIATMDLTFVTPLFGGPDDQLSANVGSFARLQPLRPPKPDGTPDFSFENEARLTIKQHTETDLGGNVRARNETTVDMVELQVLFDGRPVVTVPFRKASFTSVDGKKPDPDIDLDRIRFGGILELLARLADMIDIKGFNDPPALAVTDQGVVSSFSVAVPDLAIGIFALKNISFGAALSLSFTGQPVTLDLNFATPDNPFQVAVAMLGGGGSLAVGLSTRGLESINGMLEFGASISVDLVIARASAEVMGGIAFRYQREPEIGSLTAFLRIHGEVDILSLISVSVDLLLALEYRFDGPDAGKLTGTASVAVEVKTIFFSETVTASYSQKFAGSNGDPTFAELMAPADFPGELPWITYCNAFED